MTRSLYAATSGMLTKQRQLDVIGANIANARTAGYKKDVSLTETFPEVLATRLPQGKGGPIVRGLGTAYYGAYIKETRTAFEQGPTVETERDLDFCIEGNGFFVLEPDDGQIGTRMTRNGQFDIDEDGMLVTAMGERVLGVDGSPLYVRGEGALFADNVGNIWRGDSYVGTLGIFVPPNYANIEKQGHNVFTTDATQSEDVTCGIYNFAYEDSNVNVSDEMISMIAATRAFQTSAQMVKMSDALLARSVEEIARR